MIRRREQPAVPAFVKPLILNHNMHRVHHRYPLASWASLPDLFDADKDSFDGALIRTGLKQLKGPMRRPPSAPRRSRKFAKLQNDLTGLLNSAPLKPSLWAVPGDGPHFEAIHRELVSAHTDALTPARAFGPAGKS